MYKALVVVVLFCSSISYADLYQWTDANGVKHFSNTPPENNTETMRQMEEYAGDGKQDVDRLQKTIDLYNADTKPDTTARKRKEKSSPGVVIYTTPSCGYCQRAKAYFNQHGIRFTEHDITRSKKARQAFEALNGRGVPLIVIGDQRISGFNPSAINRVLGLP